MDALRPPEPSFGYNFPAIRGIQAHREYYISMCPLRVIPKIFRFDDEELPANLRAQRQLNRARIPEIARYILHNRDSYVFSAITASIDGEVQFEAMGTGRDASRMGVLRVSMDARFIINDGQHRRASIEQALKENPELGDESIAVVFFLDVGLKRCQQMFADLNRYAIRPSASLGILYDTRDALAQVVKRVALETLAFRDLVETERSTLSARSRKLFTLSAIYSATDELLSGREAEGLTVEQVWQLSSRYWEEVAKHFPEWKAVQENKMSSGEVRRDRLHSHGVILQALGRIGHAVLTAYPEQWPTHLRPLADIDWSRSNPDWEGRATLGGRVSKNTQNVILTTNYLKQRLGVPLTHDEQRIENAYLRGEHEHIG